MGTRTPKNIREAIHKRAKARARKANSPSIDRIVSAKGYVKGNVQIISWRANKLRADASVQELKCVLAYAKNLENFKGLG